MEIEKLKGSLIHLRARDRKKTNIIERLETEKKETQEEVKEVK